jgi:HEPN domain-containing protein
MKKPEDVGALFFKKAQQDLLAAEKLADEGAVADEIVGFHIQQAIEKGLKALLAVRSVDFRRTHDIRELMDLLAEKATALPERFCDLDEWTPYGVELRYDDIPVGIPAFERREAVEAARRFLEWLEKVLSEGYGE